MFVLLLDLGTAVLANSYLVAVAVNLDAVSYALVALGANKSYLA